MSRAKLIAASAFCVVCCGTVQAGLFPYKYHSLQVTVVDADTGEPVQDVTVSFSYQGTYYFHEPKPDSASTNSKGIATVRVANGVTDCQLSCRCKGYVDACILGAAAPMDSSITLHFERTPAVTVIVPNGYTGPIKFNMPSQRTIAQEMRRIESSPEAGKAARLREYVFRPDEKGEVDVKPSESTVSYVLQRGGLAARYEDGRPVPAAAETKAAETALRHVTPWFLSLETEQSGGDATDHTRQEIYLIGSEKEKDKLYKSLPGAERIGVDFEFEIRDHIGDEPVNFPRPSR